MSSISTLYVCSLSRAYNYRYHSILTSPKFNMNTHDKKYFMYEGANLWNSLSNGNKTKENISEFKTLFKKWNGTTCVIICRNSISYVIECLNGMLYVFHFIVVFILYCLPLSLYALTAS